MSMRTRTTSTKDPSSESTKTVEEPIVQPDPVTDKADPSPSLSQRAITQTLASTAHLANHLPTGTLLAFQLLTPTFSHNGHCDLMTRLMTQLLLLTLAASCFLASLTDSFMSSEGKLYYGLATFRGMWLFDYPTGKALPDLSKYRIRTIDWIHAVLSVLVFAALAFKDRNVLSCLYPKADEETREVLDILPVGIGFLCSMLFVVFPTKRFGIGHASSH